jgi:hypothetical protein
MSKKALTREEVITEIEKIKRDLERYGNGSGGLSPDFSYPREIKRLQYLRNSLTRRGKK